MCEAFLMYWMLTIAIIADAASLEEVLAAARERPEEAADVVDDEDSEETSSSDEVDEAGALPPRITTPELPASNLLDTIRSLEEKEAMEDSSEEEDSGEDAFTFVNRNQAEKKQIHSDGAKKVKEAAFAHVN